MKTITKVFFALLLVSVVLLASCDEDAINNLLGEHTHTFGEKWTYDETHHWHCATCEHTEEVSDKGAHSWDDGEISVAATHMVDGVKTYTCTVCGATRTEIIPANADAHTWDEEITTPATHTHDGVKKCTCTECGFTKTEVIPLVTEHIHEWKVEERNGSKLQYWECPVPDCDEMHYFGDEYAQYFEVDEYGVLSVPYEKYISLPADIMIPTIINGQIVTAIAPFALVGNPRLESIMIPLSVTNIGESAFEKCTGLAEVILPPGLTSIGVSVFEVCTGQTRKCDHAIELDEHWRERFRWLHKSFEYHFPRWIHHFGRVFI